MDKTALRDHPGSKMTKNLISGTRTQITASQPVIRSTSRETPNHVNLP